MPQILPGTCVHCDQVAIGIPSENYAAGSGKAPSVRGRKIGELPLLLARERIEGPQRSPGFFTAGLHIHASDEVMTLVVFLRRVSENVTLLRRRDIEQPGLWTVGRRKPVGGAQGSRAGSRPLLCRLAARH